MSIEIVGMENVQKELAQLEQDNVEAFARGITKAGLTLQRASQQLVPVDTGALKSSAYTKLNGAEIQSASESTSAIKRILGALGKFTQSVFGLVRKARGIQNTGPSITVEVGYTQNYAIYVHENLGANHPNGGQAKYLEEPARKLEDQLFQIVQDEVNNAGRK